MNTQDEIKDNKPVRYMLASVLFFSVMPLALSYGNAKDAPFLFNAILNFGLATSVFIFLSWSSSKILFDRQTWKTVWNNCWNVILGLAILGSFDYVLFSWSLNYIDAPIVAIVFELWPLLMIWLIASDRKSGGQFRKTMTQTILFSLLGVIGLAFVILSQNNNQNPFEIAGSNIVNAATLTGMALVFLAVIFTALPRAFTLRWGVKIAKQQSDKMGAENEFFFVILAIGIVKGVGGIIMCVVGVGLNETVNAHQGIYAFLVGVIVNAVASIFLRLANLKSDRLGVNALYYTTPIFAIIWLGVFSLVNVPHVDYLIIGSSAIVVANLLINFEVSVRRAYKALLLSLWTFGALVYLVDARFLDIVVYFSTVTAVLTMYILVIAFRLTRTATRTKDEEELSLDIAEKLTAFIFFAKARITNKDEKDLADAKEDYEQATNARNILQKLDSFDSDSGLPGLYAEMKQNFSAMRKNAMKDNEFDHVAQIYALENNTDKFVRSKQQGRNFGELMALGILGAVVIAVLLFGTPEKIIGFSIFVVDMFAILISATIIFLLFNLVDLENDRDNAIMGETQFRKVKKSDEESFFGIKFPDNATRNRGFERWLSIIVCTVIISIYSWLLWVQLPADA